MKRLIILISLVCGVYGNGYADGSRLIPSLQIGNATATVFGFNQVTSIEDGDELDWRATRIKLDLSSDLPWRVFFAGELAHGNRNGANQLRQAWLEYTTKDELKIRIGRIFVAGGFTAPGPFALETVNYPIALPFSAYAYGVQAEKRFGEMHIMGDIGGSGGQLFDSGANWENLEGSLRLTYDLTDKLSLAGTLQASDAFTRYGTDLWWTKDIWTTRAALWNSTGQDDLFDYGAYALTAVRPWKWFEFHTQIDYRRYTGGEDVVWTNGIRLWADRRDRMSFTVDYETVLSGRSEDRFLLRAQLQF